MAWEVKKLGDVCEISAGDSAPQDKKMFDGGQHLFFRTSDVGKIHVGIINNSADKLNELGVKKLTLFKKGTLLFPKSGASTFLNHRVLMAADGYVSSHLATIKANNDYLNDKFLFYFSLSIDSRDLMQDQNYPSLRLSDIQGITISVPSLPEQKRIVAILDKAFERIAKAKENTEKNAKNAKEIFESYLPKFLGAYKNDWNENTLAELSDNKDAIVSGPFGSNLKVSDYQETGIPILRLQNIGRHQFIDKAIKYITAAKARELKYHSFQHGDLVLAKLGSPIGKTCTVPKKYESGIVTADEVRIRPNPKKVNYKLLEYVLNTSFVVNQLTNNISGATRPRVNLSDVRNIKVSLPPLAKQETILEKIEQIYYCGHNLERNYLLKLEYLETLKQSILQKAFKGELTGASI